MVTRVDWINPHARLYLDVTDQRGDVEKWKLVGAGPNLLRQRGWKMETLKAGDAIIVTGYLPKNGEALWAHADEITLPDGQKLVFGMGCLHGNPSP